MRLSRQSLIVLALLYSIPLAAQQAKPKVKAGQKAKSSASLHRTTAKSEPKKPAVPQITTITTRASSEVPGRVFTLGEIADIEGGDKALIEKLKAVEIGASPLPGLSRPLSPGDITIHLRATHLESRLVQIVAPPVMRIVRAHNDVKNDAVVQAALTIAKDAIADYPGATLEPLPFTDTLTLPIGKMQIVPGAWRGRPENGKIIVPVSLNVDGKPVQTLDITFQVHRKMRLIVPNRDIEPHEIISASDLTQISMEVPSGVIRPVTARKQAIGKRTKRRLLADQPFMASALESPPAIAVNDVVSIEYLYGTVRISAAGIARQSGSVGDIIRITAIATKKEVEAVIVDSHNVRLPESEVPAQSAKAETDADTEPEGEKP